MKRSAVNSKPAKQKSASTDSIPPPFMFRLTSLQNPRIKELIHLRDGRKRRKAGRFLIDGRREVQRALANRFPVEEIFHCPQMGTDETRRWMAQQIKTLAPQVRFWEVPEAIFAKVAYGQREDGVLAVAKAGKKTLDEIYAALPTNLPVRFGILEGVEKPGNVGAVLRSADGAGMSALILTDPATDLFNPNTIRASLGTIFSVPVCVASAPEVLAWLRKHRVNIFAARVDGAIPYTRADLTGPCALALGSEAWGLTEAFRDDDIQAISLPMMGIADSLNVSTTAAILFYESLRQAGAA